MLSTLYYSLNCTLLHSTLILVSILCRPSAVHSQINWLSLFFLVLLFLPLTVIYVMGSNRWKEGKCMPPASSFTTMANNPFLQCQNALLLISLIHLPLLWVTVKLHKTSSLLAKYWLLATTRVFFQRFSRRLSIASRSRVGFPKCSTSSRHRLAFQL